MKLKCVFDVEKDESVQAEYEKIYANIIKKHGRGEYKHIDKFDFFEDYKYTSKYARTIHTGKIRPGIELTPLEISMICDGGFSHFGGSSDICTNGAFKVEILTD